MTSTFFRISMGVWSTPGLLTSGLLLLGVTVRGLVLLSRMIGFSFQERIFTISTWSIWSRRTVNSPDLRRRITSPGLSEMTLPSMKFPFRRWMRWNDVSDQPSCWRAARGDPRTTDSASSMVVINALPYPTPNRHRNVFRSYHEPCKFQCRLDSAVARNPSCRPIRTTPCDAQGHTERSTSDPPQALRSEITRHRIPQNTTRPRTVGNPSPEVPGIHSPWNSKSRLHVLLTVSLDLTPGYC